MKRIWNAIGKPTKNSNYQVKAVKHIEDLEKGKVKAFSAPKYESEKKFFDEAQKNDKIREELNKKEEKLIDNMNKFTIKSTNPPERWTVTKDLPTRESEWLHRNDPIWEYGFYEPPIEKMPKGKIMFREALEILRRMQEVHTDGTSTVAVQMRQKAESELDCHIGIERVGKEKMELVYQYFRPFERRDIQKVVSRHELARLQDALQGRGDEMSIVQDSRDEVKRLFYQKEQQYKELSDKEKNEFDEAVKQLRSLEHERLEKRLKEINEMEKKFTEAVKEAQKSSKKEE